MSRSLQSLKCFQVNESEQHREQGDVPIKIQWGFVCESDDEARDIVGFPQAVFFPSHLMHRASVDEISYSWGLVRIMQVNVKIFQLHENGIVQQRADGSF